MSYIPDLTERFPEGFGGVDMTPSYFGEPVDYSRSYVNGYEPSYEEIMAEETTMETKSPKPRLFEVGNEYTYVGFYGGVTDYKVEEIDRKNKRILLSEIWYDLDGSGTRPAQWHELSSDDNGNERALNYVSIEFGEIYIHA